MKCLDSKKKKFWYIDMLQVSQSRDMPVHELVCKSVR